MALTKDYKETVLKRIRSDEKFAAALLEEATSAIMDGDYTTGLSICRDLVHALVSFKKLSQETQIGEKSLHRMFGARGNPTLQNFSQVFSVIRKRSLKTAHCHKNKDLAEA